MEKKMPDILEGMRKRLKRRNILLDEVRTAYLKDVVVVREFLQGQDEINSSREHARTSLNLRPTLGLYAPAECTFRIAAERKNDVHGGHLEIVHHESKRVTELSKRIGVLLQIEQKSRFNAVNLDLRAQRDRLALLDKCARTRGERDQLCNEIQVLKERLQQVDDSEHKNMRRKVIVLERQLNQAERRIHELQLVANEVAHNQQETEQTNLQLLGKKHQNIELNKQLTDCKHALRRESERCKNLEIKFREECGKSCVLQEEVHHLTADLKTATSQCSDIRTNMEEARRCEAELRQKLSDLRVEYSEAVQSEELEQGELRLQLEQSKTQEQASRKTADDLSARLLKSEHAQQRALTKARAEVEANLSTKHQHTVKQLQDEITKQEEKSSRAETKLKLEQEKRALIEVELHSSQVECQQQREKGELLGDEGSRKITEIRTLLSTCPQISNIVIVDNEESEVQVVLGQVKKLIELLHDYVEQMRALEVHLEQYKSKAGAMSSDARLSSTSFPFEGTNAAPEDLQLAQVLQENSRLELEVEALSTESKQTKAKSAALTGELKKTQAELLETKRHHIVQRSELATATDFFRTELLNELNLVQSTAEVKFSILSMDAHDARLGSLEKTIDQLNYDAATFLRTTRRGDAKYFDGACQSKEACVSSHSSSSPETLVQLKVAMLFIADIVQKVSEMQSPIPSHLQACYRDLIEKIDAEDLTDILESMIYHVSTVLDDVRAELSTARNFIKAVPEDFSFVKIARKVSLLEQSPKETGDVDVVKRNVREEELPRLKQRNAAQQNFILELQEELATMKGLMFAADETKRQYSELEEKYRLLENEFTEKAESEVNSRKVKERIEMQLAMANADIASLSREKILLVDSLKENEDTAAYLESKLSYVKSNYEDLIQRECSRLETNKDVQTQFNPVLIDTVAQTSFKTSAMTLRQMNSYSHLPHRRLGLGIVTPAASSRADPGV